ncbi:MAG: 5-(carboxyamino)imidazole ribonucleotide mutase [Candidatus Limnocylindrales bacterium]
MAAPRVAILMGSRSDMPVMQPASALLTELEIEHEVRVMSAHRTPALVAEYATDAAERGLQVIVAAAGGAAHLAGVVAAHTLLPVIGVPIATPLAGGLDSLLSIVQMPRGVPVATVAVGGAENGALLAAEILALSDAAVRARLVAFRERQAQTILDDETNRLV